MISITTTIGDNATPAVARIIEALQPARINNVLRQPLETFWRRKLAPFPRLPGDFNSFPDTGFGEAASRSVRGSVVADGVHLRADHVGLRQRWKGGTIKPRNKKFLVFGIRPESYGKTPYDFGLGQISRKDKVLQARLRELFAYARKVTQRPNPGVVPTDDEFAEVANAAILRALGHTDKGGAA